MNKPTILFFSPEPPEHLWKLAASLPIERHQTHLASTDVEGIARRLNEVEPDVVFIDAHYGPSDMQYLREIMAQEEKGLEQMRLRFAKGKNLPDSIALIGLVKSLRRSVKIVLVPPKKLGVNLAKVLLEHGVSAVVDSETDKIELARAITDIAKNVTQIGKTVFNKGAKIGGDLQKIVEHVAR